MPRITPLAATRIAEPFDDPAFLYELKHDGFRALAYLQRGKPARLISRRGIDYKSYAALAAAIGKVLPLDVILDGELVVLDAEGRSQFEPLLRHRAQPVFYVFDILWWSGSDLRDLPLLKRKSILEGLLPMGSDHLLVADHVKGRGVELFRAVCEHDGEGIVAKFADAPYRLFNGRSPWFKVLNPTYGQKNGRRDLFLQRRGGRG